MPTRILTKVSSHLGQKTVCERTEQIRNRQTPGKPETFCPALAGSFLNQFIIQRKKQMTTSNKMPKRRAQEVYQLKITLKGSKPPIWRRVQVRSEITLAQLHDVIQIAMGWTDSHLHQFTVHGEAFGRPDDEGLDVHDENKACLWRLVGLRDSFLYEYDFGDDWQHQVVVEKVLPVETGAVYPLCVTGKRACPPEDVGGVWGYGDFLEAIKDPMHPDHQEMLDWIDEDFDPAAFDPAGVNLRFQRLSRWFE